MIPARAAMLGMACLVIIGASAGCIGFNLGDNESLEYLGVEQVTYELDNGTVTITDGTADIYYLAMDNETFDELDENSTMAEFLTEFTFGTENEEVDMLYATIEVDDENLTLEIKFDDFNLDSDEDENRTFYVMVDLALNQDIEIESIDEDIDSVTIYAYDNDSDAGVDFVAEAVNETVTGEEIDVALGINKLIFTIPLEYFNTTDYEVGDDVETVSIVATATLMEGIDEETIGWSMDVLPTPAEEEEEEAAAASSYLWMVLIGVIAVVVILAIMANKGQGPAEADQCPPGTYEDEYGNCRQM